MEQPLAADPCSHEAEDPADGPRVRHDGWTGARRRGFLENLAESGCVTEAARSVGMSVSSAYRLRNREVGRDFEFAWDAALAMAVPRLREALWSRAMEGQVERISRDGEVTVTRHRYDNGLGLALLKHLEQKNYRVAQITDVIVREFDTYLELIEAGAGATEFLNERCPGRDRERDLLGYIEAERSAASVDGRLA